MLELLELPDLETVSPSMLCLACDPQGPRLGSECFLTPPLLGFFLWSPSFALSDLFTPAVLGEYLELELSEMLLGDLVGVSPILLAADSIRGTAAL